MWSGDLGRTANCQQAGMSGIDKTGAVVRKTLCSTCRVFAPPLAGTHAVSLGKCTVERRLV
jgi:hypothetical protein